MSGFFSLLILALLLFCVESSQYLSKSYVLKRLGYGVVKACVLGLFLQVVWGEYGHGLGEESLGHCFLLSTILWLPMTPHPSLLCQLLLSSSLPVKVYQHFTPHSTSQRLFCSFLNRSCENIRGGSLDLEVKAPWAQIRVSGSDTCSWFMIPTSC